VPENLQFFQTFRSSFQQTAHKVDLHPDFWQWSIPERKAWFLKEVMVKYLPQEILQGDLIAGGRFNVMTSTCLNEKEARQYGKNVYGKNGARQALLWFHNHGYGNAGATSGHLIPDYDHVLKVGWKGIANEIETYYQALSEQGKKGVRGAQLRAMHTPPPYHAIWQRLMHAMYAPGCERRRSSA
jgi:formate C-acetyltransferase